MATHNRTRDCEQLTEKASKLGIAPEDLDELVHAAASEVASGVNNAGVAAQLDYLLEQGWLKKSLADELESIRKAKEQLRLKKLGSGE